MKIIGLIFLSALILLSSHKANVRSDTIEKVVIDAGHGGKDPGCIGRVAQEKDIAMQVAKEVGDLISYLNPEVKVVYTRDGNHFVELHERARLANKEHANLFISIHCNASPSHQVFGTETYTMGLHASDGNFRVAVRENSSILQENDYQKYYNGYDPRSPVAHIVMANYQNAYQEQSLDFADKVEKHFQSLAGRHSRGVKQSGFLVLWKTAMPSVLIEIGYLSNKDEELFLNQKLGRSQIAVSVYKAFREYKKDYEDRKY